MAHFAELDETNTVLRVVVISDDDCLDDNGNESEAVGVLFCEKLFGGGKWLQTSYNNSIRGTYAGQGYVYDEVNDVFVPPTVEEIPDETEC